MVQPADHPPWLDTACSELGLHETPGAAIDPGVRALFRDAGHAEVDSGDVAWCAAFAGACLARAGIPPTLSLAARSYLDWGVPLDAPKIGAIVVLSRDPDPAQGHVGFYLGETATSFLLLGGNQHNCVSVAAFPKTRLLGVRWPSPERAAATPVAAAVPPSETLFNKALAHVLEMEGGYTDDPADPGGPTNFGITLADYARYRNAAINPATIASLVADLKRISPDVVRAIYLDRYWTPAGCPDLPPPLAYFHFDTAVNMGTGTAIRMLQTALGCLVDGEMGPLTYAASSAANLAQLLAAYADLRRRRYRSLATFARFGHGWLTRVDTTLSRALALDPTLTSNLGQPPMPADQSNASTPAPFSLDPKWWGDSTTIWGAIVTGLAAILPVLGPAIGVTISPDTIHTGADQMTAIVQAAIGLAGTIATIRGRVLATQRVTQRLVSVKI